MTSVIDIQTFLPNVIRGSNCIPMTFTCHICDKLQSTEFKNLFPDYYWEHPQSNHWQYEEHIYIYIFALCVLGVVDVSRSFSLQSPSCTILDQSHWVRGVGASPELGNHRPTGQDAPAYWFGSCCRKEWIMAEFGLNGNNLSLFLLPSCCVL